MRVRPAWLVVGAVLLALAAGAYRIVDKRQTERSQAAAQTEAAKVAPPMLLSAADVLTVQSQTLAVGVEVSGPIKAANAAFVKARIAGEVQGLQVREGDFVKAGQVIGRIENSEAGARLRQAQQQAESSKTQIDVAQRNFDNNRALVEQGFISKTALESSTSALSSAQALYRAAQAAVEIAQRSLDDSVLRAPISGQVSQRLTQPGERAAVDARIVEIVDLSKLELEASVGAAESVQLAVGQSATLTVDGVAAPIGARVARINPSATAGNRSVIAYLALTDGAGLRQGLFAQGTVAVSSTTALALPVSAVRTDKPLPYVQVLVDGKVQHQTVTLGARGTAAPSSGPNPPLLVAVDGLAAGAQVLAGSVGALRPGSAVSLAAPGQ
jgi:RND family efflux transporter MFP subunit